MTLEEDSAEGRTPQPTDPEDVRRWEAAEEGAELVREGELGDAIEYLTEVIQHDPNNSYAYYFMGSAHFEAARFDFALKAYVTALEISPDYLGAMIGAGHSLRLMGKTGQAIRMGKQALLKRPEDADALHLLGYSHFQRDEKKAAADYLERFLASGPELELAQEVHGMLQVLRGEVLPLDEEEQ